MAENDGNGVIKKVSVYETSDGTIFTTQSGATEYDEAQQTAKETTKIFLKQQDMLINNSLNLSNQNGYYRMVSGQFFGTNDVYDAITSLVVDNPESTNGLITSINKIK